MHVTTSKSLSLSHSWIGDTTVSSEGWASGYGRMSIAVTRYPKDASETASVLSAAPTSRIVAPRLDLSERLEDKRNLDDSLVDLAEDNVTFSVAH